MLDEEGLQAEIWDAIEYLSWQRENPHAIDPSCPCETCQDRKSDGFVEPGFANRPRLKAA